IALPRVPRPPSPSGEPTAPPPVTAALASSHDQRSSCETRIQGQQQVQAFLNSDLADDHARRAHPQRLLDQVAEPDLPGPLQTRPAGSASPPCPGWPDRSPPTDTPDATTRSRH